MNSILSFIEYITESEKAEKKGETDSIVNSFCSAIKSTNAEESPRGSNKGPEVESLLKGVKASPGEPWCAAFIYGVLSKTLFSQEIKNKIPKTGSVQNQWKKTKGKKVINEPNLDINSVLPGMVFCYLSRDKSKGTWPGPGHTGIILSVDKANKTWTSVEGNTNPIDGGREGYGTFILTRKINDPSISTDTKDHPAKLLGFIDYFSTYRKTPGFTESLSSKLKTLYDELKTKTSNEITYLDDNKGVLDDYERNYNNRNS
jgi:hypothetical protein